MQQEMKQSEKCLSALTIYWKYVQFSLHVPNKIFLKEYNKLFSFLLCFFRNGFDKDLVCLPGFCYNEHNGPHHCNEFNFS